MRQTKRFALVFTSLVFLISLLCQAASAEEVSPRASLYLDSYGAHVYQGTSSGSLRIEFVVAATEPSDYVGVSKIAIFKSNNDCVATINGSVANGMLAANKRAMAGTYIYYGEPGVTYYAVLYMYAERDGGSDTKFYTTGNCTAPS